MQGVVRYLRARLASLAETLEQPIHECLTVNTSYSLVAQAVTAVVAPSFPVLYAGVLLSTMRVVFDASQRRIAAKAGAHAPVSRLGTPQAPPHEPAHSPKVRKLSSATEDGLSPYEEQNLVHRDGVCFARRWFKSRRMCFCGMPLSSLRTPCAVRLKLMLNSQQTSSFCGAKNICSIAVYQ